MTQSELDELHKFGRGIVGKSMCHRKGDDEILSVVNLAVAHALHSFDQSKGEWLPFVKRIVKWRLLRWMKQQRTIEQRFKRLPDDL